MDGHVVEALRLLREAGRLDFLADGGERGTRPARQAANGVAAAVTACSSPRGRRGGPLVQRERCGSEDGDPGGIVAVSTPWDEEKAGPVWLAEWSGSVAGRRCGPRR
ncbi:hypothetical protein NDU88_007585 [Pleurodeles waltl]|uniref:Uncharacterized protein n=1 Tax=Pleurodeles waltl TaxID=8319 RepID=A0AAV7QPJ7_PLEWA|nr:hypothetical protein NDU88_007585 [Pleurodeles waltl]